MPAAGFCWYELITSDVDAASAFYREVLGWQMQDSVAPGGIRYVIGSTPTGGVAGMLEMAAETMPQGAHYAWIGYLGVPDVDAAVAALERDGGAVKRPATDIPGIGRFAVVSDPQGGHFILFTPKMAGDQEQTAFGTAPGQCGWHEYFPDDVDAALDFYGRHYGWTRDQGIDMGPEMGVYQMFRTGGPMPVGGMMKRPPMVPMPLWHFYFNVESIDAGVARARAAGATVTMEAMEVPGGMWVANFMDPQGVPFGLLAPKR